MVPKEISKGNASALWTRYPTHQRSTNRYKHKTSREGEEIPREIFGMLLKLDSSSPLSEGST